ncbi:MAG: hypothetical protein Q9169_005443 [Polycauliona sp. 2 TL-2023]
MYESYIFEKVTTQQPNKEATWAIVTEFEQTNNQHALSFTNNGRPNDPSAAWDLLEGDQLMDFKPKQVDELIKRLVASNPAFEYHLDSIKPDPNYIQRGNRTVTAIQVILKRQLRMRRNLFDTEPTGLDLPHESHREVVDLGNGSQDRRLNQGGTQAFRKNTDDDSPSASGSEGENERDS